MISLDIAFKSYRYLTMEFTNAESRAIIKSSFAKDKYARETFWKIYKILEDDTLSPNSAEMVLTIQSRWKWHLG